MYLELRESELRIVTDTTAAYAMELQEFLNRCLVRGIMVAEQEWFDARIKAQLDATIDDDLPS